MENAEALVVASKETGLEVNADKTKYIVMPRDHNAGQRHSTKIVNSCAERVEELKYLEITLTYQNSIREEIKSRVKSENACYHTVQNLLFSSLLSKNLKNYYFACCFEWCETWSFTLREERWARLF